MPQNRNQGTAMAVNLMAETVFYRIDNIIALIDEIE